MKHDILKEVITKKAWLRQQKQLTQEIVLDHGLSVTGACKLTGICHSQYYYVSKKDDSAGIAALDELSFKHPVYGFRNLYAYSTQRR